MKSIKRSFAFALICLIPLGLAHAAELTDTAHPALQNELGPLPLAGIAGSGMDRNEAIAPIPGEGREGTILWTRYFADPIYTSTGISEVSGQVFVGNHYNPPKQVETVPLLGDGTPDWTFSGNEFFVDAARGADVLASVDFGDGDSTATVRRWAAGSSTPLWSYTIHPCRTMVYQGWATRKPIQVSDDGSTIAVAVVMTSGGDQLGRLHVFSANSGVPIVEWDFPTGNVVATAISADGGFVAMTGWPNVHVYDVGALTLRWSGPAGAGNDALAISGDGRYIAWGWTTFHLREWTGAAYSPLWTHTPGGGLYVGQCALDNANSRLAVAWDNGSNMVNSIALDIYDLPSVTPLWHYDYAGTPPSTHVDIPSSMVFSPGGDRLAVGSWGGSFPEIHVFDLILQEAVYTLDTPGSIFDIDIVDAPGGGSYVAACGKSVHAGTGGRGGYLYAIEIAGTGTGLAEGAPLASGFGLLGAYPNPFNPRTEIRYRLAAAGPVELAVHDASGRLVKRLRGGFAAAGEHVAVWRGDDGSGHPVASGVYLLRLSAGAATDVRKITLIE